MVHLPVDDRVVRLRPLVGADELAVAEARGGVLEPITGRHAGHAVHVRV